MLKIKLIRYQKLKNEVDAVFRDLMQGSILIIDAKLTPEEEAELIQETMKMISEKFSGIELGSIAVSHLKGSKFDKLKEKFAERLLGKRMGITIIGPAKTVRRIEKHPEELLVYF
jgi:hypothetical protein